MIADGARFVPMKGKTVRTPENRVAFLETLARTANVTGTCDTVGFARNAAYDWRQSDPEFAAAWDAALQRGVNALEDIANERARAGSDLLLIFLLKAHRPDKYREAPRLNITERRGVDYRHLTPDAIRQRIAELRQRQDGAAEDRGSIIEADNIVDLDTER